MTTPEFSDWLRGTLERTGVSRRELARRLAAKYPQDGGQDAEETQRRKVKRILSGQTRNPTQETRDSICDALGVPRKSAPPETDPADEPLTRDEVREFRRLSLKIERLLGAGALA